MKFYIQLMTLLFLTAFSISAQSVSPEQRVKDYFKAFNSGDEKSMSEFLKENVAPELFKRRPLEEQMAFYRQLRGEIESVQIKRLLTDKPTEFVAFVETKRGEQISFSFLFQPDSPQKILGMRIEHGDNPRESTDNQTALTEASFLPAVENLLDKTVKTDEFSGVVLIAKNNQPIYQKAFGLADKDKKISNRVDTKFNLGSINKTFTQAAVEQLVRQGKISLDDKLGKYLPDYPNREAAEKITVRHLLTMTSGIGDFFGAKYLATPKKNLRDIRDFIPLFSGEPLAFEPGTKSQYSNGGYVLLGALIEKVSGKNYYDYMRENIFQPLGMTNTDFYEADKPTANIAEGYTKRSENQIDKTKWQNNFDTRPVRGTSAGGGYSTAEDMVKFSLALQSGKIRLPNAANQNSFSGLGVAGGAPGINAAFEVMPESGYTIIVLSNYDPPSAGNVAGELRKMVSRIKQ